MFTITQITALLLVNSVETVQAMFTSLESKIDFLGECNPAYLASKPQFLVMPEIVTNNLLVTELQKLAPVKAKKSATPKNNEPNPADLFLNKHLALFAGIDLGDFSGGLANAIYRACQNIVLSKNDLDSLKIINRFRPYSMVSPLTVMSSKGKEYHPKKSETEVEVILTDLCKIIIDNKLDLSHFNFSEELTDALKRIERKNTEETTETVTVTASEEPADIEKTEEQEVVAKDKKAKNNQ